MSPIKEQLHDELPPLIDWLPHKEAAQFFERSVGQIRRDVAVLRELGFDFTRYAKGYDRSELETLWVFRHLVKQKGRVKAIEQIQSIMEQLNDEHDR